jgi:hypothetical protein
MYRGLSYPNLALSLWICSGGILGSSERYRSKGSVPALLARKNTREITIAKVMILDAVRLIMYANASASSI